MSYITATQTALRALGTITGVEHTPNAGLSYIDMPRSEQILIDTGKLGYDDLEYLGKLALNNNNLSNEFINLIDDSDIDNVVVNELVVYTI